MAPTLPKGKSKAKPAKPKPQRPTPTHSDDPFHVPSSKKDKRLIKRSILTARIEKANTKTKKRRRPSKKLVANLESLANALPDDDGPALLKEQANIIRHRSMKSRPGATKRKEKLEKAERERFGKNMAQMVSKEGTGTEQRAENKWAALRSFIAGTMEKKEEFVEKGK